MTKYSPSTLFKENLRNQRLHTEERESVIKAAHRLAQWIGDMPKYNCTAKVMNIQLTAGTKIRVIFKYFGNKDTLVARKIIFR